MPRPIFLTGLARGGTNLLARMLIAGGASRIAIHAFQPWFKSLRNAIIARSNRPELVSRFDTETPFGDGHFDDVQLAVQDILHGATIDMPFSEAEWPVLLENLQARAAHDAVDLCPSLVSLAGALDYRMMMDRILALVLEGHEVGTEFAGLIDTWIIDLLPALARAYPDARFLVVLRDPRAVVASTLKFLETDPTQVGHVLSIIRQWRKYAALGHQYCQDALFAGRLKLVRYEDEVSDPEGFARGLCEFLDLPYHPSMIDFSRYEDQAHDRKWHGNSNFERRFQRIDPGPAERWRRTLAPGPLATVEFCCGPDMHVCGYPPTIPFEHPTDDPLVRAFLIEDGRRDCGWRTDSGDSELEYDRESRRRRMLADADPTDVTAIRQAFLSSAYFELIRRRSRLFPSR